MLKSAFIAIAALVFSQTLGALEVKLAVEREFGCGGPPSEDEFDRIEVRRLDNSRLELMAWDVETGGCAIIPESAKAILEDSTIKLSYSRNCPAWGDPVPMCAETVRVVYVLSGVPTGSFSVVISGNNPGAVEVDG